MTTVLLVLLGLLVPGARPLSYLAGAGLIALLVLAAG